MSESSSVPLPYNLDSQPHISLDVQPVPPLYPSSNLPCHPLRHSLPTVSTSTPSLTTAVTVTYSPSID